MFRLRMKSRVLTEMDNIDCHNKEQASLVSSPILVGTSSSARLLCNFSDRNILGLSRGQCNTLLQNGVQYDRVPRQIEELYLGLCLSLSKLYLLSSPMKMIVRCAQEAK
ncbi:hypothetical protein LWI28_007502 [Acer negundo]|uniref:Uncharacterized protein n=1 Tax=Acer negundo TaxID=4023 RepID=A0AAD5IT25_ACENE|nr:hypothetical protein LWI28_007502 [Acer negundo]